MDDLYEYDFYGDEDTPEQTTKDLADVEAAEADENIAQDLADAEAAEAHLGDYDDFEESLGGAR